MASGCHEEQEPKKVGVLRDVFTTPVWRLFPLFVLYVICEYHWCPLTKRVNASPFSQLSLACQPLRMASCDTLVFTV